MSCIAHAPCRKKLWTQSYKIETQTPALCSATACVLTHKECVHIQQVSSKYAITEFISFCKGQEIHRPYNTSKCLLPSMPFTCTRVPATGGWGMVHSHPFSPCPDCCKLHKARVPFCRRAGTTREQWLQKRCREQCLLLLSPNVAKVTENCISEPFYGLTNGYWQKSWS